MLAPAVLAAPAVARAGMPERPPDPNTTIPFSATLESRGYRRIFQHPHLRGYQQKRGRAINLAAEGTFSAPPERVLAALLAYDRQVGVVSRLVESRVLRRGKGWLLVYQRLDLPVVSDRDFTLHVRWGRSGDALWLDYRVAPGYGPPPRHGAVRLTHHQGSWLLRPTADGKGTRARFLVSTEMGGWVPVWMASSRAGDDLPKLFAAIAKLIPAR